MANCTGARYYSGIATACGSRQMSWQTTMTVNEGSATFSHDTTNAAQAKIVIPVSATQTWWDGSWTNPNNQLYPQINWRNTGGGWNRGYGQYVSKWQGCGTHSRGISGSITLTVNNTTTSSLFGSYFGYDYDFPTSDSSYNSAGECLLRITWANNLRILPPEGLDAQIQSFTKTTLQTTASITSWSANTNIKGTPYTQGGGRAWNFQAEIWTGQSTSSTLIKRVQLNTGETKNATFVFDGLALEPGTTYYIRYVVSNDYQQVQELWKSFKQPYIADPAVPFKLYGKVDNAARMITKLYGPKNGVGKRIVKLYGSVSGKTRRIF